MGCRWRSARRIISFLTSDDKSQPRGPASCFRVERQYRTSEAVNTKLRELEADVSGDVNPLQMLLAAI